MPDIFDTFTFIQPLKCFLPALCIGIAHYAFKCLQRMAFNCILFQVKQTNKQKETHTTMVVSFPEMNSHYWWL